MTRLYKRNRYLFIDGQAKTLNEWAEIAGISKQLVWDRLNRQSKKLNVEDVLDLPLDVVRDAVFKPARRYRGQ